MKCKGCERKCHGLILRLYLRIWLEIQNNHKNPLPEQPVFRLKLNWGPSKYKAWVMPSIQGRRQRQIVCSSEILVSTYKSMQHYCPEDVDITWHSLQKYHICSFLIILTWKTEFILVIQTGLIFYKF